MFSVRSFQIFGRNFSGFVPPKHFFSVLVMLVLSACSVPQKLRPYSIDIRQGNYVTQEMVAQLTPGMNEEQVRFIMGSPLLIDPFHANRWDYVYRYAPQGKVSESRRITLLFKDSKLSGVEGDVIAALPSAPPAAATTQSAPATTQSEPAAKP